MKDCHCCEARIPEHASHCPHCRERQKRGQFLPQLTIMTAAAGVGLAVILQSCPALS